MPQKNPLLLMTPAAFERYVRGILKREKFKVQDLVVNHLENVEGKDGDYVMDVVATFTVFGAELNGVVPHFRAFDALVQAASQLG